MHVEGLGALDRSGQLGRSRQVGSDPSTSLSADSDVRSVVGETPLKPASKGIISRIRNVFSRQSQAPATEAPHLRYRPTDTPSVPVSTFASTVQQSRMARSAETRPAAGIVARFTGTGTPTTVFNTQLRQLFKSGVEISNVKLWMKSDSSVPREDSRANNPYDINGISFRIGNGTKFKEGVLPFKLTSTLLKITANSVHRGSVSEATVLPKAELRTVLSGEHGFSPPELVDAFLDYAKVPDRGMSLSDVTKRFVEFRDQIFCGELQQGSGDFADSISDAMSVTVLDRAPETVDSISFFESSGLDRILSKIGLGGTCKLDFSVHNGGIYLMIPSETGEKKAIRLPFMTPSRSNSPAGKRLLAQDVGRISNLFQKLNIAIGDNNPFIAYSKLCTTVSQIAEDRLTELPQDISFSEGTTIPGLSHPISDSKVHEAERRGNTLYDKSTGKVISKKGDRVGRHVSVKVIGSEAFRADDRLQQSLKTLHHLSNMDRFLSLQSSVYEVKESGSTTHFIEIATQPGDKGRRLISLNDLMWLANGKSDVVTDTLDHGSISVDLDIPEPAVATDRLTSAQQSELSQMGEVFSKLTDLELPRQSLTLDGTTLDLSNVMVRSEASSVLSIMVSDGRVFSDLLKNPRLSTFERCLQPTEIQLLAQLKENIGFALKAIAKGRSVPSSLAISISDQLRSAASVAKSYSGESGKSTQIQAFLNKLADTISAHRSPASNNLESRVAGLKLDRTNQEITIMISKRGARRSVRRFFSGIGTGIRSQIQGMSFAKDHTSPLKSFSLKHPDRLADVSDESLLETAVPDHDLFRKAIDDLKLEHPTLSNREIYTQLYEKLVTDFDTGDVSGFRQETDASNTIKRSLKKYLERKEISKGLKTVIAKGREEKVTQEIKSVFDTVSSMSRQLTANQASIKFGSGLTRLTASKNERISLVSNIAQLLSRFDGSSLSHIDRGSSEYESLMALSTVDMSQVESNGQISSSDSSKFNTSTLATIKSWLEEIVPAQEETVAAVADDTAVVETTFEAFVAGTLPERSSPTIGVAVPDQAPSYDDQISAKKIQRRELASQLSELRTLRNTQKIDVSAKKILFNFIQVSQKRSGMFHSGKKLHVSLSVSHPDRVFLSDTVTGSELMAHCKVTGSGSKVKVELEKGALNAHLKGEALEKFQTYLSSINAHISGIDRSLLSAEKVALSESALAETRASFSAKRAELQAVKTEISRLEDLRDAPPVDTRTRTDLGALVSAEIRSLSSMMSHQIRLLQNTPYSTQREEGKYRLEVMTAYARVESSGFRRAESTAELQDVRANLERDITRAKRDYTRRIETDREFMEYSMRTVLLSSEKLNNLLKFANEEEKVQIKALQKQYEKELEKLNQAQRKLDSATNNFGIIDRKLTFYKAALLKQLDLKEAQLAVRERDRDIINSTTTRIGRFFAKWSPKRLHPKINSRVSKQLSSSRNQKLFDFRVDLFKEIEDMKDLRKAKTLTSSQTEAAHKSLVSEMSWAEDYVGRVLTQKDNWVPRTRYCTFSEDGQLFVSVERLLPTADRLTPAGLRAKAPYNQQAANFQRVESYLMDELGRAKPGTKVINYRGGQLPTKEAAYEMLSTLLSDHQGDQKLDGLHINVLLTPVRGMAAYLKTKGKSSKRDDYLLRNHKANILRALRQIKTEIKTDLESGLDAGLRRHKGYSVEDIDKLLKQVMVSNSGVNEGAVGTMKQAGRVIRGGWEESIVNYNNESSERLNTVIKDRFDALDSLGDDLPSGKMLSVFHNLGAASSLALDLDQMWTSNDFARAEVGSNQFKFPATWAVLDHLLGVVSYTGCMSAKDRTFWVKALEANMKTTIFAKAERHKAMLNDLAKTAISDGVMTKAEFDSVKAILLSPSFSAVDFKAIMEAKASGMSIQAAVNAQVKVVVARAKTAMNMQAGAAGLMAQKDISMSDWDIGIDRIPTSASVRSAHPETRAALAEFPDVTPVSIYAYEDQSIIQSLLEDRSHPSEEQLRRLEQQHKERVRLRAHMGNSARVTQQNTGVIGTKLHYTKPIAQLGSGFNRAYVMYQLLKVSADDQETQFIDLTGLAELPETDDPTSKETQAYFKLEFAKLETFESASEKAIFLQNLLEELEKAKFEFTKVQTKVSA